MVNETVFLLCNRYASAESMNENSIISWEEAERIIGEGPTGVVKSGLPEHMRPTEPDNETDIDDCVSRLSKNDSSLTEVNLNNMKVWISSLL